MNKELIKEILNNSALSCKTFRKFPHVNPQVRNYFLTIENQINEAMELLEESEVIQAIENPLSKKEMEVLQLVARGFTNKEIASALSISPKTIEYHLSNIMRKTDSSKRTEAVTNALKEGWITP